MSVCLAVTKSIAVSSLGIYAGMLTTTTLVSYITPLKVITQHLSPVICKLGEVASVLATLSTGFFAASYFGAPPHLRHPYLLYGALVAPVSALYLWAISRCNHKYYSKRGCRRGGDAEDASSAPQLNDSVVDLGKDAPAGHPAISENSSAKCPFAPASKECHCHRPPRCQAKIVAHLTLISAATVAGFVASVVGVYGEGQFA
ncbi:hypothetical protein HG536_0E01090 [Torulaspora globosa]|uniref:Autophagy-related protein 33 n=1 Tax=Torulaspora globosa TaxID=48254 RepID=A0A7G3ZI62_9SACH|nr:uncharacterized protein HG536_0E01090 [Torulaspora globosa]QLL33198.1 hypothetical protein HG536_0E01090 [Torulaspora globosa]